MIKVAKFGGTSLADASQISKAARIVKADRSRRFVIVSAPGERHPTDGRVTKLLEQWWGEGCPKKNRFLKEIQQRFSAIVRELDLAINIADEFDRFRTQELLWRERADKDACRDYICSRGEYLNGVIFAAVLGFEFIDPVLFIRFGNGGKNGQFDPAETEKRARLVGLGKTSARGFVIPGFYGARPDNSVKTFSRGGSDVTGGIVAALVRANLYEKWTNVSGIFMAHPKIVHRPKKIEVLTYREARELTYMGMEVLHAETLYPMQKLGIPVNIRNTNQPEECGTMIVPDCQAPKRPPGSVIGIAGRQNFSIITVEKSLMNQELGFVRRLAAVLEACRVNFEHMPSGIDTVSVILGTSELAGEEKKIVSGLKAALRPDAIKIEHDKALICTVGQNMVATPGVAAKILAAVAEAGINIRTINQGADETNVVIGVENRDCDNAIRAIYTAFAS